MESSSLPSQEHKNSQYLRKTDISNTLTHHSSIPTELVKFSYFPKEIQLEIWRLAAENETPNHIHVRSPFISDPPPPHASALRNGIHWQQVIYHTPSVLHACHDSRAVALSIYQPAFGPELGFSFYFNFTKDVLVFHETNALQPFFYGSVNRDGSMDLAGSSRGLTYRNGQYSQPSALPQCNSFIHLHSWASQSASRNASLVQQGVRGLEGYIAVQGKARVVIRCKHVVTQPDDTQEQWRLNDRLNVQKMKQVVEKLGWAEN